VVYVLYLLLVYTTVVFVNLFVICYLRTLYRDEALVLEEYTTIQDIWKHHLDLLDYRRTELQDHYIDQGGDLKVFYTVLHTSRCEHAPPPSSSSLSSSSLSSSTSTFIAEEGGGETEELEGTEEELADGSAESFSPPVKKAADFVSQSTLANAQLPCLPEGFEDALQVLIHVSTWKLPCALSANLVNWDINMLLSCTEIAAGSIDIINIIHQGTSHSQ
jgi:hypothetical protein